jgi:hypothetical protein
VNETELEDFIGRCAERFEAKQAALAEEFHFGAGPGDFRVDLTSGKLHFPSPQPTVECEVTLIGTWAPDSGEWQWAWADKSLPAALSAPSAKLKELSTSTGQAMFADPKLEVSADGPFELLAIACDHLGAKGGFATRTGAHVAFMVITNARALRKPRPRSPRPTLAGRWVGAYMYAESPDKGSPFEAELEREGNVVRGTVVDGIGRATIEGTIRGKQVSFVKRYEAPPAVHYEGIFDAEEDGATGTWSISEGRKRLKGTWMLARKPWWQGY